jgi:RNA polymerase sigma-70 factor (ECF subfamily)
MIICPGGVMASPGNFPTTTWTLVANACDPTDAAGRAAFATLCEKYWYPLYAYIRRCGYPVEQAQDLTQEFFARVLEKRYIERADRNKGRFRTFLLSSVTYFLRDDQDRRQALKRGGGTSPVALEIRNGEETYRREPSHAETPERIFERRWALAVLERSLVRLRKELTAADADHFEQLKVFLSGESVGSTYAELAREWNTTEGALKVTIHRLRKKYRSVLRAEIAETVCGSGEIESEIHYLASVLAAK